jgi:plastocyanin
MIHRRIAVAVIACSALATAAEALTIQVRDQGQPAADVVVALDPLDASVPPSAGRATIDQVSKRFVPHISVVRTGTSVDFPNSDQIRHQVYSFSPAKPFTLKLYAGRSAPPVVFDHPGLVLLGCNIHDTMVGFVAVVDTPYFGRTAADGSLAVSAPAGRYRLRIWHPDLAAPVPARTLTLPGDGPTVTVDIKRNAAPAGVAPWLD